MDPITNAMQGTDIRFTWVLPTATNGDAITAVRVKLLNKNSNTYKTSTLCDGSNVNQLYCDITMANLQSSLGYTPGDLVKATAEAQNSKGYGASSVANTIGQVVQVVPYAPSGVTVTANSKTSLTVSWSAITTSPNNGYSTVLSYKVYSNDGVDANAPAVLKATITHPTATTTLTVTEGKTYKYKVVASNIHSDGADSDIVSQLAAEIPTTQAIVATSMSGTDVKFDWTASSDNNGAAITAQTLKILNMNTDLYVAHNDCDASNPSTLTCSVAMTKIIADLGYEPGQLIKAVVLSQNAVGWSAVSPTMTTGEIV